MTGHNRRLLTRLDRALLAMRRCVTLPEVTGLPVPGLDHGIDAAKALACMAVADLGQGRGQQPITVKDVAGALTLEHSSASRLLTETEAAGLLSRGTDPDDRRRTTVRLTEVGERLAEQLVGARTYALDQLLSDWSPADVEQLVRLLERYEVTLEARLDDVIAETIERFTGPPGTSGHSGASGAPVLAETAVAGR